MKSILVYLFFLTVLIGRAQIEIPTIAADCKEFEGVVKIDFKSLPVGCTNSPQKILLINSQVEMISFSTKYGLDQKICSYAFPKLNFETNALLYVGFGLWGNQSAQTEFYDQKDSLILLIKIITPSNLDASLNMEMNYFLVERKYCQKPIVSKTCYILKD